MNSLLKSLVSDYFCRRMCLTSRFVSVILITCSLIHCRSVDQVKSERKETGVFNLPKNISLQTNFSEKSLPSTAPGMIYVPSGVLTILDEKTETRLNVFVKSFLLDSTEVTVQDFSAFLKNQSYRTDAENFGNAGVFDMVSRSWGLVDSAYWLYPQGIHQQKASTQDPVTQISWYDADAYCKSKGKRLPHELEWEHAARNGRNDASFYSWGDDWSHRDSIFGNVWQGDFPYTFTNKDGFETTAPVGSFRSSPLGFKDLSGNVWEWCDNWRFDYDQLLNGKFALATEKVIRGGSFLCATNYCHGYRISSRMFTTPETSLFHIGCRCARDVDE